MQPEKLKIAIVGLGYVGLPLALEFGRKYQTIGFDINHHRIEDLKNGNDYTNEAKSEDLVNIENLTFTANIDEITTCNIYIITVPTPINESNEPELSALENSTKSIGSILKRGDVVIYESTVYPGLTEEVCIPILEKESNLKSNQDFFYGYSPERINPGDHNHRLTDIVKITSGSDKKTTDKIDQLYSSIIDAGTHKVSSVKVAEAAKVIENIQRDVNIALINELAMIFKKLDINTEEVLNAAATKWNFHEYKPGLVGGHCIGVDPHYLTYKARQIGVKPEMINAGRNINENMSSFVVQQTLQLMKSKDITIGHSKILILGFSFKPNCPDPRNTKVADLYKKLSDKGAIVDIYDPWNNKDQVEREYSIRLIESPKNNYYDSIILAVGHDEFASMGREKILSLAKSKNVLYDLTYVLQDHEVDGRL